MIDPLPVTLPSIEPFVSSKPFALLLTSPSFSPVPTVTELEARIPPETMLISFWAIVPIVDFPVSTLVVPFPETVVISFVPFRFKEPVLSIPALTSEFVTPNVPFDEITFAVL